MTDEKMVDTLRLVILEELGWEDDRNAEQFPGAYWGLAGDIATAVLDKLQEAYWISDGATRHYRFLMNAADQAIDRLTKRLDTLQARVDATLELCDKAKADAKDYMQETGHYVGDAVDADDVRAALTGKVDDRD